MHTLLVTTFQISAENMCCLLVCYDTYLMYMNLYVCMYVCILVEILCDWHSCCLTKSTKFDSNPLQTKGFLKIHQRSNI